MIISLSRAQSIYVYTGQEIKKVSVTATGCVSDTTVFCPGFNYFALSIFGNDFYFTSNTILYKAQLKNDSITNCNILDILPGPMSSMTVDNNGVIYSAGANTLYKYDPSGTQGWIVLGAMPFTSAGDMIFYKNNLYMASLTGIVKVNVNNPALSTMHIPINSPSLFGMAALSVDCNENKVFAFETINAGSATKVIELDLDNAVVVGTTCTIPYGVGDAASDVEAGSFSGIRLKSVDLLPQCNVPGKGMIRVVRVPGLATYTYTLNGSTSNTTGLFENLDPGSYYITITTPGGCFKDTTVNLPFFNIQPPAVQVHSKDPDCVAGGQVWYEITPDNGSYKIIHNNKDTVPSAYLFADLGEGLHHFDLVDQYKCVIDTRDINLSLKGRCDTIFFPNAFTPNNDGLNDLFRGSGNSSVRNFKLSVFNRWGRRVFMTDNILIGWNGKLGSMEQPTGIYVWMATYTTREGKSKAQKGIVAIVR